MRMVTFEKIPQIKMKSLKNQNSYLIRQSFKNYRCKSGIVIFAWRVTWKYVYTIPLRSGLSVQIIILKGLNEINECLHVKTMLASRCVLLWNYWSKFSKLWIRFLSNLCKNDLNTVQGRNLFFLANDCSVNLSDLPFPLPSKICWSL